MASYLKELMRKKDTIEEEIKTWFEVLKTQGNVGMHSPLVDPEGYPRNDIDVTQVRTARHNIICLQNDHKNIMQQIEKGLIEYHAQHNSTMETDSDNSVGTNQPTQSTVVLPPVEQEFVPFAAVNLISRASPAEAAGLKIGDILLKFGSITKRNFTGLNVIAEVVQHSKGKSVPVLVKRDHCSLSLTLTPQEWEGRGLLGCNIVPF